MTGGGLRWETPCRNLEGELHMIDGTRFGRKDRHGTYQGMDKSIQLLAIDVPQLRPAVTLRRSRALRCLGGQSPPRSQYLI